MKRLDRENSKQDVRDYMMKTCKKCGEIKSLEFFTKEKKCLDGVRPICLKCYRVTKTTYRRKNKSIIKNANLKYYYGITFEYYEFMLNKQQGKCAICQNFPKSLTKNGKLKDLAVDHDHKTGKVRGLLCTSCNRGLGNFYDNKDLLIKAIEYISLTQQVPHEEEHENKKSIINEI